MQASVCNLQLNLNDMAQQLKRWESPRRRGRNQKGKVASAKQRQYKKRQKQLLKRLKAAKGFDGGIVQTTHSSSQSKGEATLASPFCLIGSFARSLYFLGVVEREEYSSRSC